VNNAALIDQWQSHWRNHVLCIPSAVVLPCAAIVIVLEAANDDDNDEDFDKDQDDGHDLGADSLHHKSLYMKDTNYSLSCSKGLSKQLG